MSKKKRLTSLKLDEISGVTKPAQEGALMSIMKRAPEGSEGNPSKLSDESISDPSGITPQNSENMTKELEEKLEKATAQVEALTAELQVAKSVSELTDAERAHYRSLGETEQADFLAKSADERAEIAKAATATPAVVYKSANGRTFTEADDPIVVELAKEADTLRSELRDVAKERNEERYLKRAKELAAMPGKDSDKAELLKAVDAISNQETREAILKMLDAKNEALAKGANTLGHDSGDSEDGLDYNEKLTALAQKHADEHNMPLHKAYDAVLVTPKGREYYAKANQ